MPDSSLWNRYHQLLQDYIAHGDERQLREIVTLSQERGLALETTSGRVAASVRAVLSAYASIGAQSMVVDVHRQAIGNEPRPAAAEQEKCRVALSTPELGGDSVVIEIRGRCPDQDLPIVRLDYVNQGEDRIDQDRVEPEDHDELGTPSLNRPIEPRQLYDVLMGLLARDPS